MTDEDRALVEKVAREVMGWSDGSLKWEGYWMTPDRVAWYKYGWNPLHNPAHAEMVWNRLRELIKTDRHIQDAFIDSVFFQGRSENWRDVGFWLLFCPDLKRVLCMAAVAAMGEGRKR